jgi:hypothetical protein
MKKEEARTLAEIKYESGLTTISFLAILYAAIVLTPATVFTALVAGPAVSVASGYFVAFLFTQLGRIFGRPLSKQELFIIWMSVPTAASDVVFLYILQNAYFRSISPLPWGF